MEKNIDRIIKAILYLATFLLPIFYLPLTDFPIFSNKQLFLAVAVFAVLILWLLKIIKAGKVNLVWNKISWAVLALIIILGVSTFFSMVRAQSFWGVAAEPHSLFNFILYALVFFSFSNLISAKEVLNVIKIFLLSSAILSLCFLIKGFNSVGSIQALAALFGSAFVVAVFLINNRETKNKEKIFYSIVAGILFVAVVLINFWIVWLGIVFAMSIVLRRGMRILPIAIFIIALIFIFFKIPSDKILKPPAEINLTYSAGFNIAKKTLNEGVKNFVLGSGLTTFGYKYSLYRSPDINLTDLWQIRFEQAPSALITILVNTGILGVLAFLFLMGIFFYRGFIDLAYRDNKGIVLFIAGFYFLILWIFYSINFCLMAFGFLMIGLHSAAMEKNKKITLSNPPQRAFLSMFVIVIAVVLLVFEFYVFTQKYGAALMHTKGNNLKAAAMAKTNDAYYRDLSGDLLSEINGFIKDKDLSSEQKIAKIQDNLSKIQKVIQKTTEINPYNSLNWFQAGQIYEILFAFIDNVDESAIWNYKKAAELDPQNPQIFLGLGNVYEAIARKIKKDIDAFGLSKDRKEFFSQSLELAIDNFQKAIELKTNFIAAQNALTRVLTMKENEK